MGSTRELFQMKLSSTGLNQKMSRATDKPNSNIRNIKSIGDERINPSEAPRDSFPFRAPFEENAS